MSPSLQEVVGQTDQLPFRRDVFEPPKQELAKAANPVEALLRVPVVLAMVRELVEARRFTGFRSCGALYFQVHEHFTLRAAGKLRLKPNSDQLVRWSEILAATACEMMVRGIYQYAVTGSFAVRDVHQGASRRCQEPITPAEWDVIESVSGLTDRCILEGATLENLCWKHRGIDGVLLWLALGT